MAENSVWHSDAKYRDQMCSISMRFGYILVHARNLPALSLRNKDRGVAVAQFQNDISREAGWPAPEIILQKYAIVLTRIIFKKCFSNVSVHSEHGSVAQWLLGDDVNEEAARRNFPKLKDAWELLRRYDSEVWTEYMSGGLNRTTLFLGKSILQTMVNACVFRLENPGKLALPHLYGDELSEKFPLPVVLIDGQYSQLDRMSVGLNFPLNGSQMSIVEDCIMLLTLGPLERNKVQCGFIEKQTNCAYMLNGL
jgi:hypothetical protein